MRRIVVGFIAQRIRKRFISTIVKTVVTVFALEALLVRIFQPRMFGLEDKCPLSRETLTDWTGDVYYAYASDGTFTTWFTDLLWWPMMTFFAWALWKKSTTYESNRARMYGIGSTFFIGVAAAMGAWHHAFCYDLAQTCFLISWGSVGTAIMISGGCCYCSAMYLVTKDQVTPFTSIMEALLMIVFLYLGVVNYFSHRPFFLIGVLGNVLPQVVTFLVVTYYAFVDKIGFRFKDWLIYLGGFAIHMLGVYLNVTTSAACGVPCPVDCPLPVPNLNHNGLCHITEILGAPLIFFAQKSLYSAVESASTAMRKDETKSGGKKASNKDTRKLSWIPTLYGSYYSHKSHNVKLGHTHDRDKGPNSKKD